jgi:putative oxidoreductase
VKTIDVALLVVRVFFGVSLAYHGYNKFFGPGGLTGTTGWFGSIGMKWPRWQARLAATTEVGAGLLFAVGLLTPLAAAGMIGLMIVAIVVTHWVNGFFVFKPGQGWEYCASIAIVAFGVGTIGPGRYSIDHAINSDDWTYYSGWTGAAVAGVVGVFGALTQLALSYRKPAPK